MQSQISQLRENHPDVQKLNKVRTDTPQEQANPLPEAKIEPTDFAQYFRQMSQEAFLMNRLHSNWSETESKKEKQKDEGDMVQSSPPKKRQGVINIPTTIIVDHSNNAKNQIRKFQGLSMISNNYYNGSKNLKNPSNSVANNIIASNVVTSSNPIPLPKQQLRKQKRIKKRRSDKLRRIIRHIDNDENNNSWGKNGRIGKNKKKKNESDYKKNICGYITKKVLREFIGNSYKDLVTQLCQKYECNYESVKNYYLHRIQNITGPSHIPNLIICPPKSMLINRGEPQVLSQPIAPTSSGSPCPPMFPEYPYSQQIKIKKIFHEFFQWFLKQRYIRYLILEGKMFMKEAYIQYKNNQLLSIIDPRNVFYLMKKLECPGDREYREYREQQYRQIDRRKKGRNIKYCQKENQSHQVCKVEQTQKIQQQGQQKSKQNIQMQCQKQQNAQVQKQSKVNSPNTKNTCNIQYPIIIQSSRPNSVMNQAAPLLPLAIPQSQCKVQEDQVHGVNLTQGLNREI